MENKSINCAVCGCKYHDDGKNFCTLKEIRIAENGKAQNSPHCTCCNSFVLKENKDSLN